MFPRSCTPSQSPCPLAMRWLYHHSQSSDAQKHEAPRDQRSEVHRDQMHEPFSSLSATPAISSSASDCCPDPGGVRRRLLFSLSAAFWSCRPAGRLLLLLARRCVDSKSAAAAAAAGSRRGDALPEERPCLGEAPPRAARATDRAQCKRRVSRLTGGSD